MEKLAAASVRFWDGKHTQTEYRIRDWLEHPYIQVNYVNRSITGDPACDWLTFVAETVLRPARPGQILDIGCGVGPVTMALAGASIGERIVGVDTSSAAIEKAQATARERGLGDRAEFVCGATNDLSYPAGAFDAAILSMALHHILDLEGLLASLREWLKPGAPLILFEYVGPNRFQWTKSAREAGTEALRRLPEDLRVNSVSGEVVTAMWQPSYKDMLVGDVSEAIRSADMLDITECYFSLEMRRDFGGTILQPILADIAHNFRVDVPAHLRELDRLFNTERALLADGTLASNFALLLYR
jgi:SAM-dependent methyltransferase